MFVSRMLDFLALFDASGIGEDQTTNKEIANKTETNGAFRTSYCR